MKIKTLRILPDLRYCGEFTVLDDVVVISALRFNREVCGEFTVLADAVVTSAHATAMWHVLHECRLICAFELGYWNEQDVLNTADQCQVSRMPPCVHTRPTDEAGQDGHSDGSDWSPSLRYTVVW